MKKTKKNLILSLVILALTVLFTFGAGAADDLAATGQCGENVYWNYDSATGTLTISGEGEMYDYWDEEKWYGEEYGYSRSPFMYTDIKSVVIENGVSSVGDGAFYWCEKITGVSLPESITKFGYAAFEGCESLVEITIPESVTELGYCSFSCCSELKKINITDAQAWEKLDVSGSSILVNEAKVYLNGEVYTGLSQTQKDKTVTELVIPEGTTVISEYEFSDYKNLKSVTIPDTVTEIGAHAFSGCESLTEIVVPDSVKTIGYEAFAYCTSLSSVTLGNNLTEIGKDAVLETAFYKNKANWTGDLLYIGNYLLSAKDGIKKADIKKGTLLIANCVFDSENKLKTVKLPESLKYIGYAAFGDCSGIKTITIPKSVKNIDGHAFYGTGIKKITIPASVEVIGEEFTDANIFVTVNKNNKKYSSKDGVLFDKKKTVLISYPTDKKDKKYTVPKTVKTIQSFAFKDNQYLETVNIPKSVKTICSTAFYFCNKIKSVNLVKGLKTIETEAFCGCDSIKTIKIPSTATEVGLIFGENGFLGTYDEYQGSVLVYPGESNDVGEYTVKAGTKSIADRAFAENYSRVVFLPKGLKTIGAYAFAAGEENNSGLESVIIPDSVTTIKEGAFSYSALESIKLPKKLKTISEKLFKGCELESITIPKSVKTIKESAFEYAEIGTIYYTGTKAQWDKIKVEERNYVLDNANIVFGSDGSKVSKPGKITIDSITSKSKKTIELTLNLPSDAEKYQILYSTDKNFKKTEKEKGCTTENELFYLKSGETYYVKIRAYKAVNGKRIYGAFSPVKSIKVK